jgi:5-methylcytosine-specific restriction enzyme subunit McrC
VTPDAFPARTLVLTERKPHACRLAPDDVDFLLANQRGRVEVLPTSRRQVYRLTATGYVGILVAPRRRIVIRPKIPLRNLFHLLDPDADLPANTNAAAPAGDEALNFLAAQFVARLRERLEAGLHRGYAERAHQGPILQGRIDVVAQMRDALAAKEQLHSRLDDFTADVPCNRAVRAVAECLSASPLVEQRICAQLRQTLSAFADVQALPLSATLFDNAGADPLAAAYRPLLDLCRVLGEALGTQSAPGFLLDMEQVFERYVTRGVVAAFASSRRHSIAVQKSYRFHQPVSDHADLMMRPDIAIERDGRPCLVVDAKWKRTAGGHIPTDDLYQMLAYAAGLGAERVVLVYPGKRDRRRILDLLQTPVQVAVWTLRVTDTPERCRSSLRRFGRSLRTLVR